MDIEDYLSDLMEQGAADSLAGVDVDALLRGGECLGMRMHRRRRNRIVFGTTAAVVALAAGTAAIATSVGAPARSSTAASRAAHTTTPAPARSRSAAPAQTPIPTPTPPVTHQRPVTYQDVMTTFTRLLPSGISATLDPTTPVSLQAAKFTQLRIDDGHGAAVVFIGVSGPAALGGADCPAGWSAADEGPRPAGALPAGCSSETLPNGDRLLNVVTGDDGYGYYDIEVTLVRQDGVAVALTVGNGVLGTAVPVTVTRARPPLSVAQADELVRSPLWQTTVTAPGPA